ncbi:hypothetical protein SO802_024396 [Lithocarpus litseifolius]|uniref:Uncharacterized protein n=1 Tax=Lithocarpus litseifolius TaxID=425828 RepID=A0AAW2CAG8_9ROSI
MRIRQVVLQLQAVVEMGLDRGGMATSEEVAMAASDWRRWHFPALDVLICMADLYKEPAIRLVSTALSVMAYDYQTEKILVYVSDDGGSQLTLFACMEAAKFASHGLPFCRKMNIIDRSPEAYFASIKGNWRFEAWVLLQLHSSSSFNHSQSRNKKTKILPKAYLESKAVKDTKSLISDLCRQFYNLGWVFGTGGSITVKVHDASIPKPHKLIVMSPSGPEWYLPKAQGRFSLQWHSPYLLERMLTLQLLSRTKTLKQYQQSCFTPQDNSIEQEAQHQPKWSMPKECSRVVLPPTQDSISIADGDDVSFVDGTTNFEKPIGRKAEKANQKKKASGKDVGEYLAKKMKVIEDLQEQEKESLRIKAERV